MASILVIDDSPGCRNAMAALLRSAGHRVNTADNAWRGLTVLESMPVDLVILDLLLPGLNGFGFLKDVQNSRHREMPVIVATGLERDDALWQQCRPQVRQWLVKAQFSGDQLLEAVEEALGQRTDIASAA